jgi:DNA helicase HerA-like ATPase
MIKDNPTLIGQVKSISGNRVSVKIDERLKSIMPIIDGVLYKVGQIGTFIKIPIGYTNLYGIVTQIGADALPESVRETLKDGDNELLFRTRWITVVLIGETSIGTFERGITQFPNVEDEVHIVTLVDLKKIYGGIAEENSISVGNISVSESLESRLDIDKLLTRHSALVGSTGSGKSNSVAVILNSIARKKEFKSSRILLVDPHGEYKETLHEFSQTFRIGSSKENGDSELFIPYWALPFDELVSIFSGKLTDIQRDYVREKILESKLNSIKKNNLRVGLACVTADTPIPFSIKELWFSLDDFERITYSDQARITATKLEQVGDASTLKSNIYKTASTGNSAPYLNNKAKGLLQFLDSVRNKLADNRYDFLFKPGHYDPDIDGKCKSDLDELLMNWLGSDKSITILDLSGIPSEIMISLSGSLLKIVYDAIFWGQNLAVGGRKQPLLIVLEEAHNYLKAGEDSISSKIVQTISKEGRKFGVGLMLVTQRPSELDETVLSQCGTIFALRMYNQADRAHVRSALQDDLNNITDLLPTLRTGESLIIGEAVKIPTRTKFLQISGATIGTDPIASKEWLKKRPKKDDYHKLVESWRNQKIVKHNG